MGYLISLVLIGVLWSGGDDAEDEDLIVILERRYTRGEIGERFSNPISFN